MEKKYHLGLDITPLYREDGTVIPQEVAMHDPVLRDLIEELDDRACQDAVGYRPWLDEPRPELWTGQQNEEWCQMIDNHATAKLILGNILRGGSDPIPRRARLEDMENKETWQEQSELLSNEMVGFHEEYIPLLDGAIDLVRGIDNLALAAVIYRLLAEYAERVADDVPTAVHEKMHETFGAIEPYVNTLTVEGYLFLAHDLMVEVARDALLCADQTPE